MVDRRKGMEGAHVHPSIGHLSSLTESPFAAFSPERSRSRSLPLALVRTHRIPEAQALPRIHRRPKHFERFRRARRDVRVHPDQAREGRSGEELECGERSSCRGELLRSYEAGRRQTQLYHGMTMYIIFVDTSAQRKNSVVALRSHLRKSTE